MAVLTINGGDVKSPSEMKVSLFEVGSSPVRSASGDLVSDCIASRYEADKQAALIRAEQEGAYITSCEAILFELLERAGSDVFKTISKLIK